MRTKACKHCGKVFDTDRNGVYLCPECALASRRASVYRQRVCMDCGRTFMGYPKSKRCPDCQAAVQKAGHRARNKNGPRRLLGSVDQCQRCGKDYIVTSGLQRYCKDCAAVQVPENIRAHKRDYNAANSQVMAEHRVKMFSYNKVCSVCGKVFDTDTPTVTCSPECAIEWRRI